MLEALLEKNGRHGGKCHEIVAEALRMKESSGWERCVVQERVSFRTKLGLSRCAVFAGYTLDTAESKYMGKRFARQVI
jgi:hypothetical protein